MKRTSHHFVQRKVIFVLTIIFLLGLILHQGAMARSGVPESFASLAEEVGHVAVNISSTKVVRPMNRFFQFPEKEFKDFFGEDFFKHFFGEIPQEEMRQRSLGSGLVISEDGYILTNNHVVAEAEEIVVTFTEQKQYDAEIIGRDQKTDIALIKINVDRPISAAKLGDSDALKVGDWVVAVGNPFGLGNTVTAGIVSAKGRVIGAGPYDDFIQTDASINPGNSGGPLFNLDGEVVGINTAIFTQTGGNIGIGFAIPINMARSVMEQLKEKGRVTRGWLGVTIQKVTDEIKDKFDLKSTEGALVAEVMEGSPAEKAEIRRGDVIIRFDGKKVKEMNALPPMVAQTPVGKEAEVVVIRGGEEKRLAVEIAEMEEKPLRAAPPDTEIEEKFGLSVQELTPELEEALSLKDEKGVVVSSIEAGSPADEAGLS
ncbi:MAG: DegQ family serine endoprotease, partial [Thermodesulfobacteriota bacterium]